MKKLHFLKNISVCHLSESIWPKGGYFKIKDRWHHGISGYS